MLRWPASQLELPPLSRELMQRQAAAAQAAAAAAAGAGGWAAVAHEIYEEVPEYLRDEEEEEEWGAGGAEPMQASESWAGGYQQHMQYDPYHHDPYQHGQQYHQQYQQQYQQQSGGDASGAGADGALVPLHAGAGAGPEVEPGGPIRVCAGDVLRRDGPEALVWLVEQGSRPYPVKGLMDVGGLWDEVRQSVGVVVGVGVGSGSGRESDAGSRVTALWGRLGRG